VGAHHALGLRDLSRVDLIVEPDGAAYVLEVSVAPGMTETSLLPMAIGAAGLDFGKVLSALITRAATRR
jgi:D-alanine-D-alanine ligase